MVSTTALIISPHMRRRKEPSLLLPSNLRLTWSAVDAGPPLPRQRRMRIRYDSSGSRRNNIDSVVSLFAVRYLQTDVLINARARGDSVVSATDVPMRRFRTRLELGLGLGVGVCLF